MLVCVLVAVAVGIVQCAAPKGYVCPYDWSGLQRDGDRYAYYEGDELQSKLGVDVSDHNGDIDWSAAAADGVEFAFVRVGNRGYTEGALYADTRFAQNLDGAQAAGVQTGAYFFSQAVTVEEAIEEADFVLELLDGRALDLPIAYDHETVADPSGRANDVPSDVLAACTKAFCERIERAGYRTMVYGNAHDLARYDMAANEGRHVWFAAYIDGVPDVAYDFAIWQYANSGQVAGIPTNVDMNIWFTQAEL